MKIDFSQLDNIAVRKLFIDACYTGDLSLVKELLTTTEDTKCALTSKPVPARVNIAYSDNLGLIKACEGGHVDIVKYLLTGIGMKKHAKINAQKGEPLYRAIKNNHKKVVEFLLNGSELHPQQHAYIQSKDVIASMQHPEIFYYLFDTPYLREQIDLMEGYQDYFKEAAKLDDPQILKRLLSEPGAPDVHVADSMLLRTACSEGKLEIVKYILTEAPTQKIVNFLNKETNNAVFGNACISGNTELMKYLITSPELKSVLTITSESIYGFIVAADKGHKEMMKFLACSKDISTNIDWHANTDTFFDNMYKRKNEKMLTYCITELGFRRNELIRKFLEQNNNNEFAQYITHLFDTVELKSNLENGLPIPSKMGKRIKV